VQAALDEITAMGVGFAAQLVNQLAYHRVSEPDPHITSILHRRRSACTTGYPWRRCE
jgi:hypothetical protein